MTILSLLYIDQCLQISSTPLLCLIKSIQTMDYQPDWGSKSLLLLLGKQRTATLLDIVELMSHEDFKESPRYYDISKAILYTVNGSACLAVVSSFLLSRTILKSSSFFSVKKFVSDAALVGVSFYLGSWVLAGWVRQEVQKAKQSYLRRYDTDWMLHFDILCSKYGVEQEIQLSGIFSRQQIQSWLYEYLTKHVPQI